MRHSVTEARLCTLVRCCSGRLSLESLDTDCACAVLRAASCAELCLADLRLGGRATRALVAAMSAGVGTVHLGRGGEVSLHMESLARYSGRGACCSLQLWYGTWTRSAQYSSYSTVQYSTVQYGTWTRTNRTSFQNLKLGRLSTSCLHCWQEETTCRLVSTVVDLSP